jgi:hypothetical protein
VTPSEHGARSPRAAAGRAAGEREGGAADAWQARQDAYACRRSRHCRRPTFTRCRSPHSPFRDSDIRPELRSGFARLRRRSPLSLASLGFTPKPAPAGLPRTTGLPANISERASGPPY